jgi:hypothetical protein
MTICFTRPSIRPTFPVLHRRCRRRYCIVRVQRVHRHIYKPSTAAMEVYHCSDRKRTCHPKLLMEWWGIDGTIEGGLARGRDQGN